MEWQTQIAGGVVPPKRMASCHPEKPVKIKEGFRYIFGLLRAFRPNQSSEYHILYLATKLFNKFQGFN